MTQIQPLELSVSTRIEQALARPSVHNLITGIIIFNALLLGLLTYRDELPAGLVGILDFCDAAITWIFAAEIGLHLYAERLRYFRSGWNIFDFCIVAISMIPGANSFTVLRALRVLRLFRLLHIVPMMRKIVEALLRALPGMGAIAAVLSLLIYVAAVMATMMYGDSEVESVHTAFGDLPSSAFSLFQVMTGDGWSDVVRDIMSDNHPFAWVFFIIFIFIASFAVLNLFIGLIVDSLADAQRAIISESISDVADDIEQVEEKVEEGMDDLEENIEDLERVDRDILATLNEMRTEIAALKALIEAKN